MFRQKFYLSPLCSFPEPPLYFCFLLSLRHLEELLAQRSIEAKLLRQMNNEALHSHSSGFAHWTSRSITSLSLLAHQFQKQIYRFSFALKLLHPALPTTADAAPRSRQTVFTEQCPGDLHGIIARHVFRGFSAFDVDEIGLCDHTDRFGNFDAGVQ